MNKLIRFILQTKSKWFNLRVRHVNGTLGSIVEHTKKWWTTQFAVANKHKHAHKKCLVLHCAFRSSETFNKHKPGKMVVVNTQPENEKKNNRQSKFERWAGAKGKERQIKTSTTTRTMPTIIITVHLRSEQQQKNERFYIALRNDRVNTRIRVRTSYKRADCEWEYTETAAQRKYKQ